MNYVSSNPSVASVSNVGKVTIKKVGNTIITITAASTSDYLSCKFKINLKVTAPAKGTILTDTKTKAKYKVVKQGKTIEYNKPKNRNITKVSIPATITIFGTKYSVIGISTNAFCDCKKLKSITLGKNISSIGTKAFYNCNNLTKFTIPSKVAKIGKQAFCNCKKLKSITVQTTKLTEKSVGANALHP